MSPRQVVPAACHPHHDAHIRSLCRRCYQRHWYHGTLDEHPRTTRPLADTAEDYTELREQGYPFKIIAERLGLTTNGLYSAYRRAVHKGLLEPDPKTYRRR